MTRLLRLVVRNWPLKLAAVGLASLLYGGLVLSQSTQTLPAVIQVDQQNLPEGAFQLRTLDPVTSVRYFSASGVQAIASTFDAWVDLSDVPIGGGPVTVPIQVRASDDRITVQGYTPDVVTVELDRVESVEVEVAVSFGPPPAGLQVGDTVVEPATVMVTGPATAVRRVASARADVVIQPSGISVDQDVQLVAVDANGNAVSPVNLEPTAVHVTIPVFQDLRNKSLPVTPVITGDPAPGFEIAAVTVEPSVVTVEGDAEALAALTRVDTAAVSTNGASDDFTVEAELALPAGITATDAPTVQVTVELRAVTGTRNFEAGLVLTGRRADREYEVGVDSVTLTLGGSIADLDRLTGSSLAAELDVGTLEAGTTEVAVTVDLPGGVTLVASSPETVAVTVRPVATSASPTAGPTPTATAGG